MTPGLDQWVKDFVSHTQLRSHTPKLLWLWHRPAAAAPIQHLQFNTWELPYASGEALKSKKKKKKKKKKRYTNCKLKQDTTTHLLEWPKPGTRTTPSVGGAVGQ